MRLIEFRAWDKENASMLSSDLIAVAPNNGRFPEWSISGEGITVRIDSERFVLMQFTGFLDKRDKKIFEEDILRNKYTAGLVKYDEGIGAFCWSGGEDWGVIGSYDIEILGNIYQNHELLEPKSFSPVTPPATPP